MIVKSLRRARLNTGQGDGEGHLEDLAGVGADQLLNAHYAIAVALWSFAKRLPLRIAIAEAMTEFEPFVSASSIH